MKATSSEMKDMIFSVVDLINHGRKLIQDKDQRHEAALLNFQAGEKALVASTFHSAANYFMSGISLLEDDSCKTCNKSCMARNVVGTSLTSFVHMIIGEANYSLTIRLHDERMKFKFAHNQIQDAAFASIPEQLRPKLSLFIGATLLSFGEENDELGEIIFVALDLYGKGSKLIRDEEEKTKLAGYATLAGNKVRLSTQYQKYDL